MQAVSILAPALAPLAVKLIDKLIFDDDQRRSVPKIIEVPAPPQFICCCGQRTNEYDSLNRSCSTCDATKSSSYSSNKHRLSTKSSVRRLSTSDAYDKDKTKSSSSRRARTLSDSGMKCMKKTEKHNPDNTLAILASHLQKEISTNSCKIKTSSHCRSRTSCSEKLSSKTQTNKTDVITSSSSNSRRICKKSISESTKGSLKKYRDSDSYKISKT